MFRCRICTEPPFSHFFNLRIFNGYFSDERSKKTPYQLSEGDSVYDTQSYGSSLLATPSNLNSFEPRSSEEINSICLKWEKCVHERGREFWRTSECLMEVLSAIARGVNNNDDPILGDPQRCIMWYGQVSAIDGCPVIRMKRPDEVVETHTYVNRALVFLYASDESFEELQLKPRVAFNMACGNRRCVHLRHISLDD
ncbi:hypothetical protein CPHLJ_3g3870 [Cryptosporidium parvum]|uniref:Cgd3_3870 protein n=5 Tax=Cryptosporidium TaxID=5806 RepID=F0X3L7_CRYPV|nr:hypothetical protein [Cryptosporidium hominis TU502]OLQ18975.1 hypothetical protein ChTU502y2012_416g0125 [Cryptosporidium hominis]POM83292.1 hypothetical protein CmeUKMEL1_06665 [Cryptosporidium meleagridis]QOY42739.1 Uncharacterized protein CPATCC_0034880 [Cryptosporidium parvum]TRY52335.1 Uncharacterized protein CTYZ_00003112 [Cryptosporidium tyzzeri]WKS77137.1 hypothetical protein CPCDC_3g3870 [Cryptosporidium sp. 43IA8]|eukprot:QOY42739.1 hypothetical protein CPATCC_001412 [Cryptosporidium parvum]